jgi:hypothetical protein
MNLKSIYITCRETVRGNIWVARLLYLCQSVLYSNSGHFRREVLHSLRSPRTPAGVALCCRIRDEGRYLAEWIEYYLAAGVEHFFLYEKLSKDDFRTILQPYIDRGVVTLFEDWAHVPLSPAADHDCILRSLGRFEWVGFIDADEFVVIRDGRSIGEYLSLYRNEVAVALHTYIFGSNGHQARPEGPVISEYTRRETLPDAHVKVFLRPECVSRWRNSHSWYYRGMRCAVNERRRRVRGSFTVPATAETAWINHYQNKSQQDYFERATRQEICDPVGMRIGNRNRTWEGRMANELTANAQFDDRAAKYFKERSRQLPVYPELLGKIATSDAVAVSTRDLSSIRTHGSSTRT